MDGFEFSLLEIDQQLEGYRDWLSRRESSVSIFNTTIDGQKFTVNQLLDQRNEVVVLMGLFVIEQELVSGT